MCTDTFISTIAAHGMMPPDQVEPGKFYRFPGVGKGPSNKAGWCILFHDGRGGVYGDFSSNFQSAWQDSHAQHNDATWLPKLRAAERQVWEAREKNQAGAAQKAERIWSESQPADCHTYLTRKNIAAHGVRKDRYGNLVVPVYFHDAITSLQFIKQDGEKRFLSGGKVAGGWFLIGQVAATILVCEGFATGATLHEKSGHAVYCAFSAGNLVEVAQAVRKSHPSANILICADNDTETAGNPGRTYGRKAAAAARAEVIYPDFTGLSPGSDFNDYVLAGGELCL